MLFLDIWRGKSTHREPATYYTTTEGGNTSTGKNQTKITRKSGGSGRQFENQETGAAHKEARTERKGRWSPQQKKEVAWFWSSYNHRPTKQDGHWFWRFDSPFISANVSCLGKRSNRTGRSISSKIISTNYSYCFFRTRWATWAKEKEICEEINSAFIDINYAWQGERFNSKEEQ